MTCLSFRAAGRLALAALAGGTMLGAPIVPAAAPVQLVQAQAPAAPSANPAPADRSSRVEARINELHSKLKITPEQESLFAPVADAMRENARTMGELIQARREHTKTMNAVDDLKSYGDIAAAHADGLKKLTPAFEALYGSLSDEQKKTADTLFRTRMSRGRAAASKGKS